MTNQLLGREHLSDQEALVPSTTEAAEMVSPSSRRRSGEAGAGRGRVAEEGRGRAGEEQPASNIDQLIAELAATTPRGNFMDEAKLEILPRH